MFQPQEDQTEQIITAVEIVTETSAAKHSPIQAATDFIFSFGKVERQETITGTLPAEVSENETF